MSFSKSRLSYSDCASIMQRAVESPKGSKTFFTTREEAVRFSHRCNSFRLLDRKENREVYKEDETNPLYGRSVFDALVIRVVGNEVHLEKVNGPLKVEDL